MKNNVRTMKNYTELPLLKILLTSIATYLSKLVGQTLKLCLEISGIVIL